MSASASKRPLADDRLLKVVLVSRDVRREEEKARAITVTPDERAKTVHDWLVGQLEPVEDAALGALAIQHDEAYESPVKRDTTLGELGLFVKESGTIVLKVSAVMNESVQTLRWKDPYGALFQHILKEDWGQRVALGGPQAIEARRKAIRDAIKEKGEQGVEEQLLYVKSRVRGSPHSWVVELDQNEPTYKIGMDIRVTIRCVDKIGLSADDIGDTELSVKVQEMAPVSAESSSAFTFKMTLRADDLTDESGRRKGDRADAASLAWRGRRILCLPKEQPRGKEQPFTLTVTDSERRSGTSGPFFIEKEATMGDASNTPEIDATLVFKWWDETVNKAPPADSALKKIAGGSGVNIYLHPSERGQVLREFREFPSSQEAVRKFFKDLTVWRLVGGRCGDKVAKMTNGLGWYFDRQSHRAGFCMRRYYRGSLDEQLTPTMKMSDRFGLCDQVLEIMATLDGEFPNLMFPDIKPKNFLCQSHTNDALQIVLTDLDDVRRVDSRGLTSTTPYRHPDWEDGAPTKKLYEQYAVAVTLLQILLGMRSEHVWSPADYVQSTFVEPYSWITEADVELWSLRDFCPTILSRLGEFFTRDAGNLTQEEGEEGESRRYSQMRDEMKEVAEEERDYRAAPATSRGEGGNGSFTVVWPPRTQPQYFTTELWQTTINRMITKWESELATMASFRGDFRGDMEEVLETLKELKKSVGSEARDLSRVAIIASVRHVVDAVLVHLARWMRNDPRFDPTRRWKDKWHLHVLEELLEERDAPCERRRLDSSYHEEHSITTSWVFDHKTNIARLYLNLSTLRKASDKGHHIAGRQAFDHFNRQEIHSRIAKMGLLFTPTKSPPEQRMLN